MIDRVFIRVTSGNGGNGAISGRREKYVPRGGPDGGDGGSGGSIYLSGDPNVNTLLAYRYRREFKGLNGRRGDGKLRHGRDAPDLALQVPLGTEVWVDGDVPQLLGDVSEPGQSLLVAQGGRGGAGNARYATSTNRFPLLAQAGEAGEERSLRLELKLLADVGIIGAPNAGKSSLLARVSAARPKVADYPFTTLEPALGVVDHRGETFVMVDIPGLIEGAHQGVGLGQEFLRHIERTRVLIHLVDGALDDPVTEVMKINRELAEYSDDLRLKPQILAVNKLDLTDVAILEDDLRDVMSGLSAGDVYFLSAVTGQGLEQLLDAVLDSLRAAPDMSSGGTTQQTGDLPVLRPAPTRQRPTVSVDEEGAFVVDSASVARMAVMVDSENWAAKMQFYRRLERAGVIRALEDAGVESGDVVRIGDAEWRWE